MESRALFRWIVEDDQLLRNTLRSTSASSRQVAAIRQAMIEKAEALTELDVSFAAEKEIEQLLWKPCFYKRIEEFRKRIRKYASASSSDPKIKEHFQKISSDFQKFLDDATLFYERLNGYFRACFDSDKYPIDARSNSRQSCHRCMVFLGDFARYRELHNQKSKKDFSRAEGYYHKAIAIMPQRGNPHNQLAVLATYADAECIAVYRYCRSLMVRQPFSTSHENLVLLFEKNRQKASSVPISSQSIGTRPKDKTARLKQFLQQLIRVHGIFYSNNIKTEASSISKLVYSMEVHDALCSELTRLLEASAIGHALLLKALVINMFSIIQLSDPTTGQPHADNEQTHTHAVLLLFDFLTRILTYFVKLHPGQMNMILSSKESVSVQPECGFLSPVSVTGDFIQAYPILMSNPEYATSRERMIDALAAFLNRLKVSRPPSAQTLDQAAMLQESVELRGFLPLEHANEIYASDQRLPDGAPNETVGFTVRVFKVLGFADYVCSKTAVLTREGDKYIFGRIPSSVQDKAQEEDDDEVIVFNPSRPQSSKGSGALGGYANAMLFDNVHQGTTETNSKAIAPPPITYASKVMNGGSDYQMFGSPDTEGSGLGKTMWTPPKRAESTPDTFIPSFLQPPTQNPFQSDPSAALDFLELETQRYEMGNSSLSRFLSSPPPDADEKSTTTSVPPGFEDTKGLYTANPFMMSE